MASLLALALTAGCLFEVPPVVEDEDEDGASSATDTTDATDATGDDVEEPTTGPGPGEEGHLAFALYGEPYVMSAVANGELRPLRPELDGLAAGVDEPFVQISADGQWLLLSSERFHPECVGNPCLTVLPIDLSYGAALLDPAGAPLRMEDGAAIGDGGTHVVFDGGGGPHATDLWLVTAEGDGWTEPALLTADSPYAYHSTPSLDPAAARVAFDCGNEPYGAAGTAVCEVWLDGSGLVVVWSPEQAPTGTEPGGALHHPSYTPDGGLVFEGGWTGEEIWWLAAGAAEPARIRGDHNNDNSPCALPDGRVASLWLDRPGSSGTHEVELKSLDGATAEVILPDVDVLDAALGCGR